MFDCHECNVEAFEVVLDEGVWMGLIGYRHVLYHRSFGWDEVCSECGEGSDNIMDEYHKYMISSDRYFYPLEVLARYLWD